MQLCQGIAKNTRPVLGRRCKAWHNDLLLQILLPNGQISEDVESVGPVAQAPVHIAFIEL